MSLNNKTEDIDSIVDEKVKEKLEKERLNNKLDTIVNSYAIFPDIIKSLSDMRKSVESLTTTIIEIKDNQLTHTDKSKKGFFKTADELNKVFEKIRLLSIELDEMEIKLIDRNNPNSLLEILKNMFNEQNKNLIDLNNNKSIASILKKSNRLQSWITWALITVGAILGIINKIKW